MDETTLRKVQAVAAIGGGVVALHGVTSNAWQRRHTLFVGLSLAASVGLFVIPLLKKSAAPAGSAAPG